jgi:hypothetical protein
MSEAMSAKESEENISSRVLVTIDGVWIGEQIYCPLTQLGTTGKTALSLIYTLYTSPLHTP